MKRYSYSQGISQLGITQGPNEHLVRALSGGLEKLAWEGAPGPLYDIVYTAGANNNVVKVDIPALLPSSWDHVPTTVVVPDDSGLAIKQTGTSHLLLGAAFAADGTALPLGDNGGDVGNIRKVFLFNAAINREGIRRDNGTFVDIANASSDDLVKAGLVGIWVAKYDPNGLITNPYDQDAFAITINQSKASLAPLAGVEREGTALFVNGVQMTLSLITAGILVADRIRRGPSPADVQRRRVPAGRDQCLEHGEAAVANRRRHVWPVDPDQRAVPRAVFERVVHRDRDQRAHSADEQVHRQHRRRESGGVDEFGVVERVARPPGLSSGRPTTRPLR
jgi:hypothetical protein